ncbi:MAG: hypothetical protein E7032_05215 [Akkermansiaceae bacterium]|nr:hypothetical protein [Akkermansiaceae bacterium]
MMKRLHLYLILAVLTTCAAFAEAQPRMEESPLGCARRVFPMGQDWKIFALPEQVTVLRCSRKEPEYRSLHQYCVVKDDGSQTRLVHTYAVKKADDQFARFELKGNEVLAYHANGALLARMHLWEKPPVRHSPAPEYVRLRFTGTGEGLILCEAENLTDYPVLLRPGSVKIVLPEGVRTAFSNLCVLLKEERLLAPRQKMSLQLRIHAKLTINPRGLMRRKQVELVYRARDDKPISHPEAIAPAAIFQSGLPDLGDKDRLRLCRLSDELAVVEGDWVSGHLGYQLDFYRLKQGAWQLVTRVEKTANPRFGVSAYECNGSRVRLLGFDESRIMDVTVP